MEIHPATVGGHPAKLVAQRLPSVSADVNLKAMGSRAYRPTEVGLVGTLCGVKRIGVRLRWPRNSG